MVKRVGSRGSVTLLLVRQRPPHLRDRDSEICGEIVGRCAIFRLLEDADCADAGYCRTTESHVRANLHRRVGAVWLPTGSHVAVPDDSLQEDTARIREHQLIADTADDL